MKKNRDTKKDLTFGIIGLGRFGTALATTLSQSGYDIIVADRNEKRVKDVRHLTEYAYVAENLDRETLEEIGMRNCDVAIVCIGSAMDVNILTSLHLVNLGIPKVYAKATSQDQGLILEKLGVCVVYPEHDMAIRLAKKLMAERLIDYFSLNDEIDVFELMIPSTMVGKSIMEADIRKKYGLNVIAIEQGSKTIINISPSYVFGENDRIVVIGRHDAIRDFE